MRAIPQTSDTNTFGFPSQLFIKATIVFWVLALATDSSTHAQETTKSPAPFPVKVADGAIQMTAPGEWKKVKPQSRMLEAEIEVPRVEGDQQDGRLTIMGAGGTIEANIERWKGQFSVPTGDDSVGQTTIEKKEIDDQKVTFVQISGTFTDAPGGPFSGQPKVQRDDYEMIAAIIETKRNGNYFVKLYGPEATIEQNVKAFKKMIESLKVED